jgi:serine/threonine protein kinase
MKKYCPKCFSKFEPTVERCPHDGSYLLSPVDMDLTGQVLDDRYTILGRIGRGGMGIVYRAEQRYIGRVVALKVLKRDLVEDERAVRRFMTEAKAIASLDSRHTVTLHDFGVTKDGLLYYTMELLPGRPMSHLIRDESPVDYRRAVMLITQVCHSLEEAHGRGILHRDLKPDNLFVSVKEGKEEVKVLDFGIAKLIGRSGVDSMTKTGEILGTPDYLSPEQLLYYKFFPSSDLYSLAIVLYELLAGTTPFREETPVATIMAHATKMARPVSETNPAVQVPRGIERFLEKALTKDPALRYQTAAEFRQALGDAADNPEGSPGIVSLPPLSATSDGLRVLLKQTRVLPAAPGAPRQSGPVTEPTRDPRESGGGVDDTRTNGLLVATGVNRAPSKQESAPLCGEGHGGSDGDAGDALLGADPTPEFLGTGGRVWKWAIGIAVALMVLLAAVFLSAESGTRRSWGQVLGLVTEKSCGNLWGQCSGNQEECQDGRCVCLPDCGPGSCGSDGCGGICGRCKGQDVCVDGTCVCQPACDGKECGDDGCGGTCGTCSSGHICSGSDRCVMVAWTDPTSGRTWQMTPTGGSMSWSAATAHCQSLSLDGGNWRLPTIGELRSLIRPCAATGSGGTCNVHEGVCLAWERRHGSCGGCSAGGGLASGCYWPSEMNGRCAYFWSSSPVKDRSGAWRVGFRQGTIDYDVVSASESVRCVRDAPPDSLKSETVESTAKP